MTPAHLADRVPVAIRRYSGSAGGSSDRLGDEYCRSLRASRFDRLFQAVGVKPGAISRVGGIGAAVLADRRDPYRLPEPGLVRPAQGLPSRHVECPSRISVIRGLAGDDHRSVRLTSGQVISAGHLERALHRLGSARYREDSRSIHRDEAGDSLGVALDGIGGEGRSVYPID